MCNFLNSPMPNFLNIKKYNLIACHTNIDLFTTYSTRLMSHCILLDITVANFRNNKSITSSGLPHEEDKCWGLQLLSYVAPLGTNVPLYVFWASLDLIFEIKYKSTSSGIHTFLVFATFSSTRVV
jgi:hypothetical protein